jgi:PII-like signaling protein
VFRGLEGFGDSAEIHRHRIAHRGQSIAVTIVDTADTHRLIPEVEAMMDTGMIATSDVDCIRIEKPGGA